ncbi:hypothetical protein V1264_023334 [Littorina saxatilis]
MTANRICLENVVLLIVLQTLGGLTEALIWRAEQGISYYSNYVSISPIRFSVPADRGEAVWRFRASKSPNSCDVKTVSIFLQYGSLPVVNPLNEKFPEKFYLGRSHLVHLNVSSNNVSASHTQLFPQPGDWYALAFIPESNDQITQKGLTVSCKYKFSASLEMKELPPYDHLNINQVSDLKLTGPLGHGVWVGFKVPATALTVQLDATVTNCSLDSCYLQLANLDDETGQLMITNCSNANKRNCSLNLSSPLLGFKHFVHLQLLSGNASVEVNFTAEECSEAKEPADNSTFYCELQPSLDRFQKPGDFSTNFVRLYNDTVQQNEFLLSNTSTTVVPFSVERMTDIGGTLGVKVSFKKSDVAEDQNVRVCGQVKVNRLPLLTDDLDLCANVTNSLRVNSSSEGEDGIVSSNVYVPYPEEGMWQLALRLECYNATNSSSAIVECVNGTQNVTVAVNIDSCVDGECNGQGECREYIRSSDFIVFSSCVCTAGWRGYGCTDGREAYSGSSQLTEVLLLTISNLFFMPAIFVALHRRYYIEAMVYFYNMFFSTFYHACDGDRIDKYVYCMTKYSVLATGDFLASTCSLWVTLIAMAQIPIDFSSAIQMAGPLALIMGVLLDRHSLWVIAVPTGVGLLLVIVSWTKRCCSNKRCFPDKRRYLWMLPGVLFAVAGAVMFAFFETAKNYKYIHSAWHVCLSLCIIFLLPPRRKEKVVMSVNFDDTESTEGLVLGPNNYTRRMNFEL